MSRAHCASSRSRTLGDPTSAVPMQLQRSSLLSKTTIRATHRNPSKASQEIKASGCRKGKRESAGKSTERSNESNTASHLGAAGPCTVLEGTR